MHIILDCDGVLVDLLRALLLEINTELQPGEVTEWDMFSFMSDAEARQARLVMSGERIRLDDMRPFWERLPLVTGAQPAVSKLRASHDVTVVTSPWAACNTWASHRYKLLRGHFRIPQKDVIIARKKFVVEGDVFIDDKPDNVASWASAHPTKLALLFDQPYNQDAALDRVLNWDDALARIDAFKEDL